MWTAKKQQSLRKIAHHNSFFARSLQQSQRRVFALKQRIEKLKKVQELHLKQVAKANRRVDDILSFGMREDTLRAEISDLEKKRGKLYIKIAELEALVKQIKLHIRNGLKRH